MQEIKQIIEIFLHIDKYLTEVVNNYGVWTNLILFMIIFVETGLIIMPFLPGDSLLFVAGSLSALGSLNVHFVFVLLSIAAFLGDTVNYWIGRKIGPAIFERENTRFIKKKHLIKTHDFYEKHGGITIIIARFMPIVRTFAPFIAGVAKMTYPKFISYNLIGGVLWVGLFVYGGYFFGNIDFVKKNFSLVIVAIIIVSIMPPVIEYLRHKFKKEKENT